MVMHSVEETQTAQPVDKGPSADVFVDSQAVHTVGLDAYLTLALSMILVEKMQSVRTMETGQHVAVHLVTLEIRMNVV